MSNAFDHDYPSEPIGGGNPYYRCAHCKISDPQINGQLKNHLSSCKYRIMQESAAAPEGGALKVSESRPVLYSDDYASTQAAAPATPERAEASRAYRCEDCGDVLPKEQCWCSKHCVHADHPEATPERAAPSGQGLTEERLLAITGDWDFAIPTGAFDEIIATALQAEPQAAQGVEPVPDLWVSPTDLRPSYGMPRGKVIFASFANERGYTVPVYFATPQAAPQAVPDWAKGNPLEEAVQTAIFNYRLTHGPNALIAVLAASSAAQEDRS